MRPLIDAELALIFYFLLRASFLAIGAGTKTLIFFGLAAISGRVGMFTQRTTDKIRELADTFFRIRDRVEGSG